MAKQSSPADRIEACDVHGDPASDGYRAGYLKFPYLQDMANSVMEQHPRPLAVHIDRSKITFEEFETSDGERYLLYACYPGLTRFRLEAALETDSQFLLQYSAYAFGAQLASMSGHELFEFLEGVSAVADNPGKEAILERVALRFETREASIEWFETAPLPGFSGLTAKELVARGRGREVIDYIAAVDCGGFA